MSALTPHERAMEALRREVAGLIEALQDQRGPSLVLDHQIWSVTGDSDRFVDVPAYTASIDAAVALVERVLPGTAFIRMSTCEDGIVGGHCSIAGNPNSFLSTVHERGAFSSTPECRKTLPIAICLALLRALLKEHGNG